MNDALRRRLLFWAPIGLALLLILVWLFRPTPVPVDLVTAERGPLSVTVSDEGETRVRDVFVISAPVTGNMQRVDLEAGDPVVAAETVVALIEPSAATPLDPRTRAEAQAAREGADAARKLARAQVERAQAEYEFALAEYPRIKALAEQNTLSQNELDAAERRLKATRAALAEARAALKVREFDYQQATARLQGPVSVTRNDDCDCVRVRSPVSGTVLRVVTESEGVVQAGQPLIELGDPADLEIVVDLLSADAVRVKPGQHVIIEAWGGGEPLEGVVKRVEPFGFMKVSALGIEEQRVNVIIDLTDAREKWERLGHGYRVEPRIVLWKSEDVLRIPLSALFRQGAQWAVFVSDDGRAVRREVEVGHQNGLEAEILAGLQPGEQIVRHPSERISEGTRIEPRG